MRHPVIDAKGMDKFMVLFGNLLYFEIFNFVFFIPRRNRYVLVANFGDEHVNLEPVGQIYSGGELVLDTSNTLNFIDQEENLSNQVVKFSSIDLQPNEAIVIKLPK